MKKDPKKLRKLLENAGLPWNVNDIIGHMFSFEYYDQNGEQQYAVIGGITGVGYSMSRKKDDNYSDLKLFPLRVFVEDHQIHCFRYLEFGKWAAIVVPEEGKKGLEGLVKGTFEMV